LAKCRNKNKDEVNRKQRENREKRGNLDEVNRKIRENREANKNEVNRKFREYRAKKKLSNNQNQFLSNLIFNIYSYYRIYT